LIIIFVVWGRVECVKSQNITQVSGVVKDSVTGELLPFVNVIFQNTTVGSSTNDAGKFSLRNDKGYTGLQISYIGYQTKIVPIKPGQTYAAHEILLQPAAYELGVVTIRPTRERYVRRNNPAVELIRNVIERKNDNRIVSKDEYQAESYEKLSISLDKFDVDFEKNKFLSKFNFVKSYLDSSEFDGKTILTLSLREKLSNVYYRKEPKTVKTILFAKRQRGLDKTFDEYGTLSANLDEMFKEVNIYDNDVNFLLNRFVSPLSSTLATTYYQYFIMDTLNIGGDRCVDLAFVPVNSQSYGFTGRLYITLDGNYSVKKVRLNVPSHINLNYVKDIRIDQEFKQLDDGLWALDKSNTYVVFYFVEGAQQMYAHQLKSYDKYSYEIANRDSIFRLLGETHAVALDVSQPEVFWVNYRHIPIKEKENAIDQLMSQLKEVPVFKAFVKTIEILISGYIPVNDEHDRNKFDFGPMNTTFSSNEVEGVRLRMGGATTANLFPRFFWNGYGAIGMNDRKWKYHSKLTYSFNEKAYHENEAPLNNLSLMHEYDIYTPGQDFLFTSKDNMFVALKVGKTLNKMNYLRTTKLQYEKEWLNGLPVKTWFQLQNNEATGALRYILQDDDDQLLRIKSINTSEWGVQLRFAPGERPYNSRLGKGSIFNLSKDAPVFKIGHQIGFKDVLSGQYNYHHTEAGISKRVWLSSFGYIDVNAKAGKIWDKVPFPLLIMPNTNQSITIQPEAFHLMNALEFVADQYVSLDATYYLKGWILNRIPLVNLLQMREVVGFNAVYGSLSEKNNPAVSSNLFTFPEGVYPLEKKPYMEFNFGLENIFRILQVNYYRRLTYLEHPNISRNGFRIAMRFSF
jgi:hypothetical protein